MNKYRFIQKNYIVWLMVLTIATAVSVQTYAALPPHARHTECNVVPTGDGQNTATADAADEDDAAAGHGGHHGGGHHHSGGHYHGGHSHHSYHSPRGHYHHYAEHYHHYHHHYHTYHDTWWWGTDYAGWSVIFDVLGLIPIFLFSALGVVFGIIGMNRGHRRQLATAGLIIGIVEIVALAALIAIL